MKSLSKVIVSILLTIPVAGFLAGCETCEFESISTSSLPAGTVGTAYTATIETSESCNANSWRSSLLSGNLPPGVSLDEDGNLNGTPTTEGTYTFTVRIEICFEGSSPNYSDCHEKSKGFSIQVDPAP